MVLKYHVDCSEESDEAAGERWLCAWRRGHKTSINALGLQIHITPVARLEKLKAIVHFAWKVLL